ncbi:MAG: homoserine kinase [Rhodospirillales bacterium]|nr:homoserine kinase [Alphaproteobacteria bacterium]MCB9986030.1 homoserine kinase [Rhodospirillales bacterium]USO07396.1 MAG: homoserine kinase [Rhodospirillales bacterium]
MAVYTPVDASAVRAFIQGHGVGEYRDHQGITQGVENTNYHLFTDAGRYVLTLFEKRVNPENLPFIFSFISHLARAGVPVPECMGSPGVLAGKPAAIITFLDGRDIALEDVTPGHAAQVGAALARMHLAARDFAPARINPVGVPEWRALFDAVREAADPALFELAQTALDEAASLAWGALPSGAVHADLFVDNVFFDSTGTLSGVIDFGFACTAPYAYDLAITLNAWCYDRRGKARVDCVAAMLAAYRALRPLDADERAAFPALRRAAALRFLATRLYDWTFTPPGADVVRKDPDEYAAKLKADFQWP